MLTSYNYFLENIFQSTLPRGERRNNAGGIRAFKDFNPRSREGSDFQAARAGPDRQNFNPRSREGSDFFLRGCFTAKT